MTIVAAVDGEQIPDRVAEIGADLATQYGEELVVVHVMPRETYEVRDNDGKSASFGYPSAPGTEYGNAGSEASYSIDRAQRDAAGVARDITEQTVDDLPESVSYVGRIGEVVTEVLSVAEEHDPTFLVVGGRKRTPVGKAVFGSSTQSFLLNADVPVVTVMTEE
jgi:nucleotide-binding universal stress UspA family protein